MDSEVQENSIDWEEVSSSNLEKIRYNKKEKVLDIKFHNNEEHFYRYFGVDLNHYNYLASKSGNQMGWYFWRVFRNSYPFEKIKLEEESAT